MSDDTVDQVNRFVITLAALIVIFVALTVVLLAWGAADSSIGRIEDFAGYLRDHDGQGAKLIVTIGAVVIVLVMAMLIILELTPSPLQRMRIRNVQAVDATLTTTEIAWRVEEEVRAVEHVADAVAVIAARGNRIGVALDLHVDPGADLARTADEACRRVHELVEKRMGITLASRPRARMHYRELVLKDGGQQRVPDAMRRPNTGWERPYGQQRRDGDTDDDRRDADAPEEAQA